MRVYLFADIMGTAKDDVSFVIHPEFMPAVICQMGGRSIVMMFLVMDFLLLYKVIKSDLPAKVRREV